jgi:hypothetical protein
MSKASSVISETRQVTMETVLYEGEQYFKINHVDAMKPFFMSIVSDANHWLFIASNGGLSAGRKNPEFALFPYYTDDKITESAEITGSKSIFQVQTPEGVAIWEPFSERFAYKYQTSRNLYKSVYGNKIIFEEINHSLDLAFRYQWNTSKRFGFVRKAVLTNLSPVRRYITLVDGIQNIMPYGVPPDLQRSTSNLVDAYKRNELEPAAGIGIYALSAIIVDRAEPSEALKANIAWMYGLENTTHLLSSTQLNKFRAGQAVQPEADVKGEKGAFFVAVALELTANDSKKWGIVANVNQTQSDVVALSQLIRNKAGLEALLEADIANGTEQLVKLVASSDGLQATADPLNDARHYSNVLFNIMRGGIFDNNYQIEKRDFSRYLTHANKALAEQHAGFLASLPEVFSQETLKEKALALQDADLVRLAVEYLPLKFSRRHGDPSRPWNNFSINTQSEEDGSKILDYEGNWRDLFQNWEALSCAYPEFIEGMIFKFLNATTFDGYNPYRVTKGGFDWEIIEPDNPWSYIGYWGDHQIIYLQKFLEIIESHRPGALPTLFDKEWFVYAAVPYLIKPYEEILQHPKDTIAFDEHWDTTIRKKRDALGADGALLTAGDQQIYHVNFLEKILATVLAKLSNFIPETGIWMNTQRPEWNDANNALVGNGVSMVTLCYLYRFMHFFRQTLEATELESVKISAEMIDFYLHIRECMQDMHPLLESAFSDADRKAMLDRLGKAASEYRQHIYQKGFWGNKRSISIAGLKRFADLSLDFMAHTIRANKRSDGLYHAYNLMTVTEAGVSRDHLSEMLEGQVAVLSAGFLQPQETLSVLTALKNSALFRPDQYSYILYPNKNLAGFLHKNNITEADVQSSALLTQLLADGHTGIVETDIAGGCHFNGNFRNAQDLAKALGKLGTGKYAGLVKQEQQKVLGIFEKVFNHKAFTGRSGTFFAFEGLGSIYWHMVSKLLLAAQECCWQALEAGADAVTIGKLLEHYYEIEAGIGVHKTPELYGAFPTDPYSHTPLHRGAQQPGMTGQVKEDILSRFGELGVKVEAGCLLFEPALLRRVELLQNNREFTCYDVANQPKHIALGKGQLVFTYCAVPIVYTASDTEEIAVKLASGESRKVAGKKLDLHTSQAIFRRSGEVEQLVVHFKPVR